MCERWFDERYYLKDDYGDEIRYIYRKKNVWDKMSESDKNKYSSLINDYHSYLKVASKLVDELSIGKDSLSKINIVSFLIRQGVFSYTPRFKGSPNTDNIIDTVDGINILDGEGCCRHVSEFISDIMPESRVLTCVYGVDNPFESKANHAVNLVEYKGVPYAFDAYNGGWVFKFDNEFNMSLIDSNIDVRYGYKPYGEIIYYKRTLEDIKKFLEQIKSNERQTLTSRKFNVIILKTSLCGMLKKDIIKDFISDTSLQMEGIKEKIKEIKINR